MWLVRMWLWRYQEFGTNFNKRVLSSIGNKILRSIVAQHSNEKMLSKREEVLSRIKVELIKRGAHFHLILVDVVITQLTFG